MKMELSFLKMVSWVSVWSKKCLYSTRPLSQRPKATCSKCFQVLCRLVILLYDIKEVVVCNWLLCSSLYIYPVCVCVFITAHKSVGGFAHYCCCNNNYMSSYGHHHQRENLDWCWWHHSKNPNNHKTNFFLPK